MTTPSSNDWRSVKLVLLCAVACALYLGGPVVFVTTSQGAGIAMMIVGAPITAMCVEILDSKGKE